MMYNELNVKVVGQTKDRSCWAAIANSIIDYYNREKGEQIESVTQVNEWGNPITKLDEKKILVSTPGIDDEALVSMECIKKQIDDGNLFVCCVKEGAKPKRNREGKYIPNKECKKGHWIAIVGYNEENNEICVVDPAGSGSKEWVGHDIKYREMYFRSCSYIDIFESKKLRPERI